MDLEPPGPSDSSDPCWFSSCKARLSPCPSHEDARDAPTISDRYVFFVFINLFSHILLRFPALLSTWSLPLPLLPSSSTPLSPLEKGRSPRDINQIWHGHVFCMRSRAATSRSKVAMWTSKHGSALGAHLGVFFKCHRIRWLHPFTVSHRSEGFLEVKACASEPRAFW